MPAISRSDLVSIKRALVETRKFIIDAEAAASADPALQKRLRGILALVDDELDDIGLRLPRLPAAARAY